MDWGKIFDFLPSSKTMANIGQFASPLVSLYSANRQADALDEQNDLTKKNYAYNKSINDREIAKENMSQSNITEGFANIFGDGKKKKSLDTYSGMTNYQG